MFLRRHQDVLVGIVLALLLGGAWAWRDAANLSILRLPDTDDVVRLQQVRDWLGGQPFGDLVQHRLAGGLPMHWSRLADLGPAALIVALRPLVGTHAAEVAAVATWPLALFAAALTLVARIARRVGVEPVPAAIVAAIAYPATTVFLPGRIDHHGLQVVLLLAAVLGLFRHDARGAAIAGLAAGAGLIVGLETAPLLAVLGLVAVADWVGDRTADERLAAFGVGALAALLAGRIAFAGSGFDYPACDGFTAQAWTAALTLTAAPVLLAGLGGHLASSRGRLVTALGVGGGVAALALLRSPGCLAPYGHVDPLLARLWLAQVGEAQSVLAAPLATSLGYGGAMVAGLAASAWRWRLLRTRAWALLTLLLVAATLVAALQLRGAYAGAMLAAPGLAAAIAAARTRGALALAAAWAASAGMLYPLAADALARPIEGTTAPVARGDCASPALLARLAALRPGLVLAPVDTGAWGLAATPHRFLAAPYHRDTAGMLAAYRFYLGPAARSSVAARRLGVDYVLACAAMPGADRPGSTAAALAAGRLVGFRTIVRAPDGATIVTTDRLSAGGLTP